MRRDWFMTFYAVAFWVAGILDMAEQFGIPPLPWDIPLIVWFALAAICTKLSTNNAT